MKNSVQDKFGIFQLTFLAVSALAQEFFSLEVNQLLKWKNYNFHSVTLSLKTKFTSFNILWFVNCI